MPNHGSSPVRNAGLIALLVLAPVATVVASEPARPTVVVDIHGAGAAAVARLKQSKGVHWSAEFGGELLLALDPDAEAAWLARPGVRPGPGTLRREELWIRDHVCTHKALQPALGQVGGYEVLRMPAASLKRLAVSDASGFPLPADGVVAREAGNAGGLKAARAALPATQTIVDRIDAERWFQTMSALAAFNRNSFSPALGSAHDWIRDALGAVSDETTTFQYTLEGLSNCGSPAPPAVTIANPIAFQYGSVAPDEWIVIGAHYDSRNSSRCDGFAAPQPGANDNASGCAGVIELARVFASVPTARTIVYTCFSGEEQGLWGSRRWVESLQAAGTIGRVRHMINLDMIGYDPSGALDARIETNTANQGLIAQYVAAAQTYAPTLNLITSTNTGAYSDHWYFLAAGVPAMFTWENGASIYPHYHQATDLPQNMTRARELAGAILRMDAAVIVDLAGGTGLFEDGFEE